MEQKRLGTLLHRQCSVIFYDISLTYGVKKNILPLAQMSAQKYAESVRKEGHQTEGHCSCYYSQMQRVQRNYSAMLNQLG